MIVQNITSKSVTTKFGPKPAYSIKCDGEWYSYGFTKPKFEEGAEVEFSFEENSYGKQVDVKSLRVISSGSGSPSKGSTSASSDSAKGEVATRSFGAPARPFPIPALHGDRAIVRQNSLTNAVNLLKDYVSKKSPEEMADTVIAMARMFEAYSCGDLDVAAAKKLAGVDSEN